MLETILREKIVAILRGVPEDKLLATAEALYAGGIRLLEVTCNTPGALAGIERLRAAFAGRLAVGAGTVLNAQAAGAAIAAGAEFLLSPNLDRGMVEECVRAGRLAVPGVMTPTEIVQAGAYGAQIVKIFPAVVLGPTYFKQVRGPLNGLKAMAVGGIDDANFRDYLRAGAVAVGVGGKLVDLQLIEAGDYEALAERARAFTR